MIYSQISEAMHMWWYNLLSWTALPELPYTRLISFLIIRKMETFLWQDILLFSQSNYSPLHEY